MSRMWWYTLGALILWVINPELRRVFEWRFGYAPVDVFPLLPFLAVLPHIFSLTYGGGWSRLPKPLSIATWVWLGGFSYAFVLAILNHNLLPGAYVYANFVLPTGIGLWVAADTTPFPQAYARTTRLLFALTTAVSVYGIVQYVVAPQWDAFWLQHVIKGGVLTFGRPAPYQIRVFSMLSSPASFGNFMALMLLLALPQLSLRRPITLVQIPIWLVAFGLSLDRTGWLIFASGAVIYLLLTPRRGALLATASLSAAMVAGLIVVFAATAGNDTVITTLGNRLATFTDLDHDRSGNDRRNLYETGVDLVSQSPFGQGLGVFGTATKLGEAGATNDFDSGILARLVEMGLPGAALFLVALGVFAAAIVRVWQSAGRERDGALQSTAAVAFAILVSLIQSEIFGDVGGLLILTLWLICGLALRGYVPVRPVVLQTFRAGLTC